MTNIGDRKILGGALTPVYVAGSGVAVPVSDGLTDTELRATAVPVGVSTVVLPTTLYHDVVTVVTATTRVVLGASQVLISGVTVKAAVANTGTVYVGGSTVAAANGFRLASGDSIFLEIANLATVYVDASINAQVVTYIAS